jgi:hypothetical protein
MLELRGLVRDGVRYTRSGGRRRGGAHEGGAPAQGSGRGSDNKGRHHHDQEEVLLKSGKTTGSKGSKGSKSKSKRGKGPKKVSPGPEASSNAANARSRVVMWILLAAAPQRPGSGRQPARGTWQWGLGKRVSRCNLDVYAVHGFHASAVNHKYTDIIQD